MKQIRKILQEQKKQKPLSQNAKKKLANILQNQVPKKSDETTKTIAEKAGQRVGELAVEKGSKQIRKILQERKKQEPLSQDAKKKLVNILQKTKIPKKSDALVKLNRILAKEI